MGEEVKYFIGFQDENGEIISLPAYIINSAEYDKPNRLKSIVTFTQRFASVEELVPHLITDTFVPNEKKLGIYKKEVNKETGLEETTELRWGLPFSDTIPFFQINFIQKYLKEYISPDPKSNPNYDLSAKIDFMEALIKFFQRYFGLKKPMPAVFQNRDQEYDFFEKFVPKFHSVYCDLFKYQDILKERKKNAENKTFKIGAKQKQYEDTLVGDCRAALDKMIKSMLYEKPFEVGEEPIDYEAFYDLAMFVYNYEQIHHLEDSKKVVVPSFNRQSRSRTHGYAQSDEAPEQGSLFNK